MTRAILALSDSTATRPLSLVGHFISAFWLELTSHRYRPERHYMRGPGPAWRAKHGGLPGA
jgi:hypothetical protein